jgi:secreted trypsin-like serine protease
LSIDNPSGKSDASGGRHGFMLPWAKCALAGRMPTAIITALAPFAFASLPAGALVGGAPPANQAIARHVVLIVGTQSLCSGVAIASDLVLTAAHCVLANGKYRLVTFEGRQASVRDVARVVPHPQFSLQTGEFQDLALVKLAASPPPNLRPAPLSDRRAPASFGDRFIVAGFGVATKGQTKSAGTLRMATLVATDRPSSQQLTLVDPKKLGEAPGLGVCNGDSGGPVFDERNLTLVGIISWSGPRNGEPACGFVSGIIPLERYRHWIADTADVLGSRVEP